MSTIFHSLFSVVNNRSHCPGRSCTYRDGSAPHVISRSQIIHCDLDDLSTITEENVKFAFI